MTTLKESDQTDLFSRQRHAKLVDFMGEAHPIPVNRTQDARILVTASRDKSQIGQVLPFEVQYANGQADTLSGGYFVKGPICDPGNHNQVRDSTLSGAMVAFPYEDGWLYGSIAEVLPERKGYKVAVQGGVGVAVHVDTGGRRDATRWYVKAPYVFKLPVISALPQLTDQYPTVRAKLTATELRLDVMKIQHGLMEAMMDRDMYDTISNMPRFKYENAWHYEAQVTLADVTRTPVAQPDLPHPAITLASDTQSVVQAVTFQPEVPQFAVKADDPETAEERGRKAMESWVRSKFPHTTVVLRIDEQDIYYAGVVR